MLGEAGGEVCAAGESVHEHRKASRADGFQRVGCNRARSSRRVVVAALFAQVVLVRNERERREDELVGAGEFNPRCLVEQKGAVAVAARHKHEDAAGFTDRNILPVVECGSRDARCGSQVNMHPCVSWGALQPEGR